jgi:hypothetical protein
VARPIGAHDRRVEIEGRARLVDHGRAGDTERRNIAARERGARDGRAKRTLPDLRATLRVERENFIVLCGNDQLALARSRPAPKQRLRIDLALKSGMERGVKAQAPSTLIGEAGHHVSPGAVERAVVGQDGLSGMRRSGGKERDGDECVSHR